MATSWKIGEIIVTRIEESVDHSSVAPDQFLTGFDAEIFHGHDGWMAPTYYDPAADRLMLSIHSWLIRTPRHTILLDTCSGNHKDRPFSPRFHMLDFPYLERLRAAGVGPEAVDIVLCTHLHTDHCGWNTQLRDGRWVPTFPNARYLFSKAEADAWNPAINPTGSAQVYLDSVLPVVEAGQAELLTGAHQIDDALLIEPAPGHTPGHIILKAGRGDDQGLFCGDAIHHPVQVFEPHWNTKFCQDPELARHTRRGLLEHCVEERALLFPMHFAAPHVAGIMERRGRFSPSFIPPTGLGRP